MPSLWGFRRVAVHPLKRMDTKNGDFEKVFWVSTCVKINMKPKNHPIEKENHLPSTSIFGFHVNLPGCMFNFEGLQYIVLP